MGLSIPSSDPAGLKAFVDHVSTPGDALFHKFITSDEFAANFGGNAADYQSLKDWAAKNGLTISQESKARNLLTVRGTVGTFNRLFKTQINNYKTSDGVTFYSAGIKPIVPAELASKVQAVIGLTSGKPIAAQAKVGKALGENPAANSALKPADRAEALGTGPGGTYGPQDLRTAYSIRPGVNSNPVKLWAYSSKGITILKTSISTRRTSKLGHILTDRRVGGRLSNYPGRRD